MKLYGVGWYGEGASIAQTGFEFSKDAAERIAREGAEAPGFWAWAIGQDFQVDELSDGEGLPVVRADLETEDETNEVFGAWVKS